MAAAAAAAAGLSVGARHGFGARTPAGCRRGGWSIRRRPWESRWADLHRPPDNPRRITGIRQGTSAQALWLACGDVQAAIVSLDMLDVSYEFTGRVQVEVARDGHPGLARPRPRHAMLTACPHSTSHQWGRSRGSTWPRWRSRSSKRAAWLKAISPRPRPISARPVPSGANFNRTTKKFKTDAEFTKDSDRGTAGSIRCSTCCGWSGQRPADAGMVPLLQPSSSLPRQPGRTGLAGLVANRVGETRKVAGLSPGPCGRREPRRRRSGLRGRADRRRGLRCLGRP